MADERPQDIGRPSANDERPKRPAPTLDRDAVQTSDDAMNDDLIVERADTAQPRRPGIVPAAVISTIFGGSAAALVLAAAWWTGWLVPKAPPTPTPAVTVNTAAIDALAVRLTNVEAKANAPSVPAPDPAATARLDAMEKSLASIRAEVAAARTQSEQLATAVNEIKAAPHETPPPSTPAPPPTDLSPVNDRMAQLETGIKAVAAQIAQSKTPPAANDVPLRRAVAAALLDLSVRQGESYAAALTAAKPLAPNADALKPLEPFAASGVPGAAAISSEVAAIIAKLPRATSDSSVTGSIIDRLQAGASRLVHIQRTDAPAGTSHDAVLARAAVAARRNDVAEARRELNTLAPSDRSAFQSWIDKVDARDAALAVSRQFAADMMTALNKPAP
jgi:hypothetical protein